MQQIGLFGHDPAPRIDSSFGAIERITLDHGAWLDVARGWLSGHATLFEELRSAVAWTSERRLMYDRTVDVPRLYSVLREGDAVPPLLDEMRRALDRRYGTAFCKISVALYRDGNDSVAWHGDYVARHLHETQVATVSVGHPRKFLIREAGGGTSRSLSLGWGDLLVMGGTCQRTYQHAIPKTAHAEPRIAIMFRPDWDDRD